MRSSTTSVRDSVPTHEAPGAFVSLLVRRSKVALTAAALNGVPSWNLTPRRSLKVITVPSREISQDSASAGMNSPVRRSAVTRVSYMRAWARPTDGVR